MGVAEQQTTSGGRCIQTHNQTLRRSQPFSESGRLLIMALPPSDQLGSVPELAADRPTTQRASESSPRMMACAKLSMLVALHVRRAVDEVPV